MGILGRINTGPQTLRESVVRRFVLLAVFSISLPLAGLLAAETGGTLQPAVIERIAPGEAATPPIPDWMQGMPLGFRTIALKVCADRPPHRGIARDELVDIHWVLPAGGGSPGGDSTVVFRDVRLLDSKAIGEGRGGQPVRRLVVIALAPSQALRLALLGSTGQLSLSAPPDRDAAAGGASPVWRVESIQDQTETVETQLAAYSGNPARLERPTLAPPRRGLSPAGGTIAIPVEIQAASAPPRASGTIGPRELSTYQPARCLSARIARRIDKRTKKVFLTPPSS